MASDHQDLGKRPPALQAAILACRDHFIYAGLFSALLNLLYLAPTLYMLQVYDRVIPTRGHLTLLFLTLALAVSLFVLAALEFVRSRLLMRAGVMLDAKLIEPVLRLAVSRLAILSPHLVTRAVREFDVFRQAVTGPGTIALFDLPWTPIYVIVCTIIHPWLGLLAVIGIVCLSLLAYLNERTTHQPMKFAAEAANVNLSGLQQSIAHADIVHSLGMGPALVKLHQQQRVEATRLQVDANFLAGGHLALSKFLRLFLQSLALGLGAYLAIEQRISAGSIFAASLLIGRALAPIDQVLAASKSLISGWDAYGNLSALLSADEDATSRTRLPAPTGEVTVEGVSVLNGDKTDLILRDISFQVGAGEAIGIIGPSGAGKSTLVRALAGARSIDRGVIRFNDADVSHWHREDLARFIGYLPQDSSLLAGTIKDNISRFAQHLGTDPALVDGKVVEAAQICGVHKHILHLPAGYDTVLDLNGRGLSGGHAQRVALARALYDMPKIVILDEPNAHLDQEGEAMLLKALKFLKSQGVTVFVVAHRSGILPVLDKLLVLDEGRMTLYGPCARVLEALNAQSRIAPQTPRVATAASQ